jgi:hypothetical protein
VFQKKLFEKEKRRFAQSWPFSSDRFIAPFGFLRDLPFEAGGTENPDHLSKKE